MKRKASSSKIREIMAQFADRTGLSPAGKVPRRYLWTDAFAVCNFLELYRQTAEADYRLLALRLIDQVHTQLGRHRQDDSRTGWISGLDEQEGKRHPTRGGLRIGKAMRERKVADPIDERLEWDRDGQYFHYLTKWMHALNCTSRVTGDSRYNEWAIELAKTAQARFTYVPPSGGRKRMVWKMSIDLSYPIVPSMGHHDPLDGYITYNQLQATTEKLFEKTSWTDLEAEIADMAGISAGTDWTTDDPLGIGGLLFDSGRVAQLMVRGYVEQSDLLRILLDASLKGLESYARQGHLKYPAEYRLAFRELGLSIGLHALEKLPEMFQDNPSLFEKTGSLSRQIESLRQFSPLIEAIEKFWLEPASQASSTWKDHQDINMVMLATSLSPASFLTI